MPALVVSDSPLLRYDPASAVTLRCPCFAKDQPGHPCPGVRWMQLTLVLSFGAVRLTLRRFSNAQAWNVRTVQ